ncbi:MAG: hypothetical protein R3F56_18890 [Planctomycetota bacterium]
MTDAETQLAGFFARYEPAIARLGKALRTKLRARLPGLSEIVYLYERQRSLVISYSPTEHGYQAVCTLALYPEQVKLFFARGPLLSKADPNKLLRGTGKMVRYVPMDKAADFDRAEIEALMVAALGLAKLRPAAGGERALIIKADEQRKRATRTSKAASRASPTQRKTTQRKTTQRQTSRPKTTRP